MFFRVEARTDAFRVRLLPNHYWPESPIADVSDQLERLGWVGLDPHGWELACREDAQLIEGLSAAHAAFARELADAYVRSSPDDHDVPPCPHAILFWDWKDAPPFEEFTEVSDALLSHGAERVVFNAVDTGEDTYGLVIADRELPPAQADEIWNIFWTECPEDEADCMMVVHRVDGTYGRVWPLRS
jgi:hypothetical protein